MTARSRGALMFVAGWVVASGAACAANEAVPAGGGADVGAAEVATAPEVTATEDTTTEDTATDDLSLPPEAEAPMTFAPHDKGPVLSQKAKQVKVKHISAIADVPTKALATLAYRIYDFDVGTGLAILVQGKKFNLLFDGGSGDDLGKLGSSAGNRNRLLAYLFATLGPSGPAECAPLGDAWAGYAGDKKVKLHHVVLSHAHLDHGSYLADVLACYDVVNVWDTGAINDTEFYLAFLKAVAAEVGVTYHTVAGPSANRGITVAGQTVTLPVKTKWVSFSEGTRVALDDAAAFAVLYADPNKHADMNQNSLVLRLDLGSISVLLTGDAESGARKDPSAPPGDIEAALIERHLSELDADILQVGHHGSLSSNRLAFLEAVSPLWAIMGVGPKQYSGVTLPDKAVISALASVKAAVFRTDLGDAKCPAADRIGMDDESPGGCDAYAMEIAAFKPKVPSGTTEEAFYASCAGRCGDASTTGCSCSPNCRATNSCCPDVCDQCATLPLCASPTSAKYSGFDAGCAGLCEDGGTVGDCGCGAGCVAEGNCCLDLCQSCPAQPVCAPGQEDDPFN